uniref:Serpentine Receptor, class T n=1 Tax=Steinernema glaseri TaxID=37863 RepID=A0A1I7YFB7_9BILA
METLRVVVGLFYIICPLVLLPIYVRILCIFISKKMYKKNEPYRIMILMGIIQCATAPAGYVLAGVVHLLDYDPWGIAAIALKFYPGGFRAESMISFVLALNRFRIICGLRYPEVIHKVLMIFACCFGVTYTVLLFTPLCEYRIIPGHYLMEYNESILSCRMIQIIGSYFITVPSFASLLLYIVMIGHMVKMRMKCNVPTGSAEERRILFYALTRFVIEFSFVATYHYAAFPHYPEYDITINVGLMFCSLLVSPALYLVFYRSLRQEFFPSNPYSISSSVNVFFVTR